MNASIYTRPNKPIFKKVTRHTIEQKLILPEVNQVSISVDKSTECHVTPFNEAGYMVDELELCDGMSLCEPSAGTGNLINAVYDSGFTDYKNITVIERHYSLCEYMRNRWEGNQSLTPIQSCFLEYAEEAAAKGVSFSRIIMNPPFRKIKLHIEAALSLLGSGGILVALVPVSFEHNEAHTLKVLEKGIFSTTNVICKIIKIYKDEDSL